MSVQSFKRRIDTGVAGDSSTGDTIHAGGNGINDNFDSLYNVMGDYRLYQSSDNGTNVQKLHATGFYQKHTRAYYNGAATPNGNPVDYGSMHDVSTTRNGIGPLTINLPTGLNHQGECIEIINTDGSVNETNYVEIKCSNVADSFAGLGNVLRLTVPKFKLTLWIEKSEQTGSVWNYKIDNLYGDNAVAYDISVTDIGINETRQIPLFNKSQYNTSKHILFVSQKGVNVHLESSECLLMVNNTNISDNTVYFTEYARIRTSEPTSSAANLLYEVEYLIIGGVVNARIRNISNNIIDVKIKAIDSLGRF